MAEHPPSDAAPAKAGGTNKLLLIGGMVVAAAVGGGATFVLTKKEPPPEGAAPAAGKKPAGEAAHKEVEEEADDDAGVPEDEKEHPTVNLPAFTVNIGEDVADQHFLKVSIAVQLEAVGEEAGAEFEPKAAKVRSGVLMYLSSLKLEDVQGTENRKKVLKELRKHARRAAGHNVIRDVYLTEMVVQ